MIPLRDDNPTELQPFVTAFIAACVVVFPYQVTLPEQGGQRFVFPAHVGGFITGAVLILRQRSSRIPDSGGDDNPRGPWA